MSTPRALQIALLGARRRLILHDRTEEALHRAAQAIGVERGEPVPVLPRWLPYDELQCDVERALGSCDAVIAPTCDPAGWEDVALEAIQVARVLRMPLLATGGGFELSVREVLQNTGPEHERRVAETAIVEDCGRITARVGAARDAEVQFVPGTRLADSYGAPGAREAFLEAAGLAASLEGRLEQKGLRAAARRADGPVCALELVGRMFHVLLCYAPELTSTGNRPHPAFRGLLEAALAQTTTSPAAATQLWAWPQ